MNSSESDRDIAAPRRPSRQGSSRRRARNQSSSSSSARKDLPFPLNLVGTNEEPKRRRLPYNHPSVIAAAVASSTMTPETPRGANVPLRHPTLGYTIPPMLPAKVAKRNARERNRVQQVNSGFEVLRTHIPGLIDAEPDPKTGAKKCSKVDTLRRAVEYINSLKQILSDSDSNEVDGDNGPDPDLQSQPVEAEELQTESTTFMQDRRSTIRRSLGDSISSLDDTSWSAGDEVDENCSQTESAAQEQQNAFKLGENASVGSYESVDCQPIASYRSTYSAHAWTYPPQLLPYGSHSHAHYSGPISYNVGGGVQSYAQNWPVSQSPVRSSSSSSHNNQSHTIRHGQTHVQNRNVSTFYDDGYCGDEPGSVEFGKCTEEEELLDAIMSWQNGDESTATAS